MTGVLITAAIIGAGTAGVTCVIAATAALVRRAEAAERLADTYRASATAQAAALESIADSYRTIAVAQADRAGVEVRRITREDALLDPGAGR